LPAIWNACWSDEKGREKVVDEALEALNIPENEIKDKKFFGGETIGYWVETLQEIAGLELLTLKKFQRYLNGVKNLTITLLSRKGYLLEMNYLRFSKLLLQKSRANFRGRFHNFPSKNNHVVMS
jgi:hypothetical protein